jgi:hypothetical protein
MKAKIRNLSSLLVKFNRMKQRSPMNAKELQRHELEFSYHPYLFKYREYLKENMLKEISTKRDQANFWNKRLDRDEKNVDEIYSLAELRKVREVRSFSSENSPKNFATKIDSIQMKPVT